MRRLLFLLVPVLAVVILGWVTPQSEARFLRRRVVRVVRPVYYPRVYVRPVVYARPYRVYARRVYYRRPVAVVPVRAYYPRPIIYRRPVYVRSYAGYVSPSYGYAAYYSGGGYVHVRAYGW